jgi:hypothetical protein
VVQQARKSTTKDDERRERAIDIMTASGWKPQPGDRVIGTVVAISTRDMADPTWKNPDGGNVYPVVTVELDEPIQQPDNNGKPVTFVAVHAFHTTVYNGFKALRVKSGSRVGVVYGGKKVKNSTKDLPEDKQQTVQVYTVFDPDVEPDSGEFDWAGTSPSDEPSF